MVAQRLEVRLDPERRAKLAELVQKRDEGISDMVRRLIDEEHERLLADERRRAVEIICSLEIEDVPDPEELSRQLAQTHELPDLY